MKTKNTHNSSIRSDERANSRNVIFSKSFTVVIRPLSTRLIKPNFHVSRSTTLSLETRNLFILLIVPGMLEYESIPGVSSSKPFGGRTKSHADITVKSITHMVSIIQ